MTMEINIKPNDYEKPSEVRQEVVQAICDAFLGNNCWTTYHPFSSSAYRRADRFVVRNKGHEWHGFNDSFADHQEGLEFNGAEMEAAFQALIKAGYFMFCGYDYGTWKAYRCQRRPFNNDGWRMVSRFEDRID